MFFLEDIILYKLITNIDLANTEYLIINYKFELKTFLIFPIMGLNLTCEFMSWSLRDDPVDMLKYALSARKRVNLVDVWYILGNTEFWCFIYRDYFLNNVYPYEQYLKATQIFNYFNLICLKDEINISHKKGLGRYLYTQNWLLRCFYKKIGTIMIRPNPNNEVFVREKTIPTMCFFYNKLFFSRNSLPINVTLYVTSFIQPYLTFSKIKITNLQKLYPIKSGSVNLPKLCNCGDPLINMSYDACLSNETKDFRVCLKLPIDPKYPKTRPVYARFYNSIENYRRYRRRNLWFLYKSPERTLLLNSIPKGCLQWNWRWTVGIDEESFYRKCWQWRSRLPFRLWERYRRYCRDKGSRITLWLFPRKVWEPRTWRLYPSRNCSNFDRNLWNLLARLKVPKNNYLPPKRIRITLNPQNLKKLYYAGILKLWRPLDENLINLVTNLILPTDNSLLLKQIKIIFSGENLKKLYRTSRLNPHKPLRADLLNLLTRLKLARNSYLLLKWSRITLNNTDLLRLYQASALELWKPLRINLLNSLNTIRLLEYNRSLIEQAIVTFSPQNLNKLYYASILKLWRPLDENLINLLINPILPTENSLLPKQDKIILSGENLKKLYYAGILKLWRPLDGNLLNLLANLILSTGNSLLPKQNKIILSGQNLEKLYYTNRLNLSKPLSDNLLNLLTRLKLARNSYLLLGWSKTALNNSNLLKLYQLYALELWKPLSINLLNSLTIIRLPKNSCSLIKQTSTTFSPKTIEKLYQASGLRLWKLLDISLWDWLTRLRLAQYNRFCRRIMVTYSDENLEKFYHIRLYRNTGLHTPLKLNPDTYLAVRYRKTYPSRSLALAYVDKPYDVCSRRALTRPFIEHKAPFFLNNYYFRPRNTRLATLLSFIPEINILRPSPTLIPNTYNLTMEFFTKVISNTKVCYTINTSNSYCYFKDMFSFEKTTYYNLGLIDFTCIIANSNLLSTDLKTTLINHCQRTPTQILFREFYLLQIPSCQLLSNNFIVKKRLKWRYKIILGIRRSLLFEGVLSLCQTPSINNILIISNSVISDLMPYLITPSYNFCKFKNLTQKSFISTPMYNRYISDSAILDYSFYLNVYSMNRLYGNYTVNRPLMHPNATKIPEQFNFGKLSEFKPLRRLFIHHGRVYLGPVTRFRKQNTLPDEFTGRFVYWHRNKFWLQTWFYPHKRRYCPFTKVQTFWWSLLVQEKNLIVNSKENYQQQEDKLRVYQTYIIQDNITTNIEDLKS